MSQTQLEGASKPGEGTALVLGSPTSPARLINPEDVGVTSRRWLVLILFMLYGFSNQLQYVAYVTIVDEAKQYFGVSAAELNALPALYSVVYVIFVFPACKAYGHIGLRKGMLLGASLNFVGSLLKLVAAIWAPYYALLVFAGLLNAGAQVLFLGLPPMVASIWFADDERTLATALGTLTGFVGMAVGMFYSPRVLNDFDSLQTGMSALMATQAVAAAIPTFGILLFVSNAPEKPPSVTANSGAESIPSVLAVLKRLLKNRTYVLATFMFGIVVGLFTAIATVLSQMMKPLGLSETQTGVLGFAGILSGAFSCAVISPIIDKLRRYRLPWLILIFAQVVLVTIMCIGFYTLDSYVVAAFTLVIAVEIVTLPQFPVVMELSVEMTYPEPESITGSALMLSLSIWSVIGTVVFSIILGNNPTVGDSRILINTMLGVLIVVWISVFLGVKEKLVRRDVEAASPKLSSALNKGDGRLQF